jgi:cytochrome c5
MGPPTVLRATSLALVTCGAWAASASLASARDHVARESAVPNAAEGLAAWQQVYSVLTSPRCINCHTATSHPQQGDDRHRHFANVVRGPEGKGVPALQCVTCHQESNADSTGVPGGRGWHLAPLSMRWQDTSGNILSSTEVCRAITDRSKNHDLDGPGLVKHHEEEPLVRWAFQPGRQIDGTARTLPPLTLEQFLAATRRWVDAGVPCPGNR